MKHTTHQIFSTFILFALILAHVSVPLPAEAAFSGVTARGSNTTGTGNNTSISVTPTGTIAVDKIAFFATVTDNEGTSDGCGGTLHTLDGTAGNEWTKILECTETDGASDDGNTISLFYTKVSTAITTSDSVTVSFNTGRSDIIGMLFEVTVGAGKTIAVEQIGEGQNSLSASVSGMASREYLLVGLLGGEGEDSAKTPDGDYVERYDLISTGSGSASNNVHAHLQTRIATLTADTVTSSAVTGTNSFQSLTAIYETDGPTIPTVTTGVSANVSPSSARLFGNIVSNGGGSITQHGFATSTDPTLATNVSTTTLGTGSVGEFSGTVLLSALDTTYYYRAYALNAAGRGYGTIRSFNSGNTSITRTIRFFEGFIIKFISGTIKFFGR